MARRSPALPLGALLSALLSAPACLAAVPGPAASCASAMQGRYAVMAMGTQGSTPTAAVLEERWLANGVIKGTLVERSGRSQRQGSYTGKLINSGSCVVQLERQLPWGVERSEAVLDGRGRPLYSLNRTAGSVITGRWLPMAPGRCTLDSLNGVVLSSQVGLSWIKNSWSPNAVVQRERWKHGQVEGVALSSTNGMGQTASYSGVLRLDPDSCWGTLQERDALGQVYNYRSLIVLGRQAARGYLYLQSDPDDLTVGWLVHD